MTAKRRSALARMERVIERKRALIARATPPAPEVVEPVVVATVQSSPYDRARVAKWVSDRLVAGLPGLCWHCRRPFIVGQQFVDIRGNDVVVRFHQFCRAEWLAQQEALARKALGLPAIEDPAIKETTTP